MPDMLDNFLNKLNKLGISRKEHIALAVSGGADSMALCLLCKQSGLNFTALIVDHKYRKESSKEAKEVKEYLAKSLKLKAEKVIILKNDKPIPNTGTEEFLREVRFELLSNYCEKKNINKLLTAHHLDDQIETFLMRLERGAGLDGLTGIKERSQFTNHNSKITIIRPLLSSTKEELKNILAKHKIKWWEDKTNKDIKHTRNNIRASLEGFSDYDLIRKRLNGVIENLSRAKDFIEEEKNKALQKISYISEIGFICLDLKGFKKLHEELRFRILKDFILYISSSEKDIRFDKIKNLNDNINSKTFKSCTLYGVEAFLDKDKLYFIKEFSKLESYTIEGKKEIIWNNNFEIIFSNNLKGYYISPLGDTSIKSNIPKKILKTIPSLKAKSKNKSGKMVEKLLFVPHIDFTENKKYSGTFRYRFFSN